MEGLENKVEDGVPTSGNKQNSYDSVEKPMTEFLRRVYGKAYNAITNRDYWTDVSSGWTFFTPICAAIEKYGPAHMDWSEVITSR